MNERTRNLLLGFAGGLGATAILPFVKPVLAEVVRPLTKALLKKSILTADRMRTLVARATEALEDIMAEVHAEVDEELQGGNITKGS